MFIPLLLILIGFVFLLKNIGVITSDIWSIIWPLVIILIGLYMIAKSHRYRMFWGRLWKKLE